jgi:AcrR family transcriptional regulator
VAERLFAERGIHGVSLREIAEEAGQRNNAAVQYHFGGRDDLVRVLFERGFVRLDRRRAGILAELDAAGRGSELEGLVRALVVPFTEAMGTRSGGTWIRLVARMHEDPRFNPFGQNSDDRHPYTAGEEVTAATREVAVRIQAALGLDRAQAMARFFITTTMVVHVVADREALAVAGAAGTIEPPGALATSLVQAALAVLRR